MNPLNPNTIYLPASTDFTIGKGANVQIDSIILTGTITFKNNAGDTLWTIVAPSTAVQYDGPFNFIGDSAGVSKLSTSILSSAILIHPHQEHKR